MAASRVARRACGANATGRLWLPRAVVRSSTTGRVTAAAERARRRRRALHDGRAAPSRRGDCGFPAPSFGRRRVMGLAHGFFGRRKHKCEHTDYCTTLLADGLRGSRETGFPCACFLARSQIHIAIAGQPPKILPGPKRPKSPRRPRREAQRRHKLYQRRNSIVKRRVACF